MMQCDAEAYPVGDAAFSLIISHPNGVWERPVSPGSTPSIPGKSCATEPIQSEDDVAVAVVDTSHMDLAWRNSVTANGVANS
jgi:hypothetical protein